MESIESYKIGNVIISREGMGFRARRGSEFSPVLPLTQAFDYFKAEVTYKPGMFSVLTDGFIDYKRADRTGAEKLAHAYLNSVKAGWAAIYAPNGTLILNLKKEGK